MADQPKKPKGIKRSRIAELERYEIELKALREQKMKVDGALYAQNRRLSSDVHTQRNINIGLKDQANGFIRYAPNHNESVIEATDWLADSQNGIRNSSKKQHQKKLPFRDMFVIGAIVAVVIAIIVSPQSTADLTRFAGSTQGGIEIIAIAGAAVGFMYFRQRKNSRKSN